MVEQIRKRGRHAKVLGRNQRENEGTRGRTREGEEREWSCGGSLCRCKGVRERFRDFWKRVLEFQKKWERRGKDHIFRDFSI